VWTADDVARLIESSTSNFYLFLSFLGNIITILKDDKNQIDHKTLQRSILYSTVLYLFIYLLYEYSKSFVQSDVKPVVQPAVKCRQL